MPDWDVIYRARADFTDLVRAAQQARDELKRLQDAAKQEADAETDGALKAAAAHEVDTKAIDQQRLAMEKAATSAKGYNSQVNFGGRSTMDQHLRDLEKERQTQDLLNRARWQGFTSPQQDFSYREQQRQQRLLSNRAEQAGYTTPDQYLTYLANYRREMDAQAASLRQRNQEVTDSASAYTKQADAITQAHASTGQLGDKGAGNVQAYSQALSALPGQVSTKVRLDTSDGLKDISVWQTALELIPDLVSTRARLDTTELSSDIAKAQAELATLPASKDISATLGRPEHAAGAVAQDVPKAASQATQDLTGQRPRDTLGRYTSGPPVPPGTPAGSTGPPPDKSLPPGAQRSAGANQAVMDWARSRLGGAPSGAPSAAEAAASTTAAGAADAVAKNADPKIAIKNQAKALSDIGAVKQAMADLSRMIASPQVKVNSGQVITSLQVIKTAIAALQESTKGLNIEPAGMSKLTSTFASVQQQASRAFSDIKSTGASSADSTGQRFRALGSVVVDIFRSMKASSDDAAQHVSGTFATLGARISGALKGVGGGDIIKTFTNLASAAASAGSAVVGGLGPMMATFTSLIQLLPPAVAGFGALSTVFAIMPALVSAVASGMATLKQAIDPVVTALSAYGAVLAAQQAAMANPIQTAMQMAQMQNQVANAYYGVQQAAYQATQTQLQNAHAVTDSAFALSQAQITSANSQITSQHAIQDAIFGVQQADFQATQSRINDAHAVQDAQYTLSQAIFSQSIQQTASSMSVAGAFHTLQDAQFSVTQAQIQLNMAWQTAAQDLASLEIQVNYASVNLRGAQLNLMQAQQSYAQVMAQSNSTALARAQAAYQVQAAEEALAQTEQQNSVNETQLANVRKYGAGQVFGVTQATQALTDAQFANTQAQQQLVITQKQAANDQIQAAHAVQEAMFSLTQALVGQANDQVVNAHTIADAQFGLSQAYFSAGQSGVQNAQAVRDAQFGLTQAQVAQAQGFITSSHNQTQATFTLNQALDQMALGLPSVASAQENLNTALSKLGPAAKQAVVDLMPLVSYWITNKSVADAFFAKVDPALARIGTIVKPLNDFLVATAGALGTVVSSFVVWFEKLASSPAWKVLTAGNVTIIKGLGAALLLVVDGFTHLALVAQPFTAWMITGIEKLAKKFDDWAIKADKPTSNFSKWLVAVKPALHDIGRVLDAIITGFATIAGGPMGSPGSQRALHSFEQIMTMLATVILPNVFAVLAALARPALLSALTKMFGALSQLMLVVVQNPAFLQAFNLFVGGMTALANLITKLAGLPVVGQAISVVAAGLLGISVLKFAGVLTLVSNLRQVAAYAKSAWGYIALLVNKIPGINLPGAGKGGSTTGPNTPAGMMNTAADKQLEAAKLMNTAGDKQKEAATGESVAGDKQKEAAAGGGAAGAASGEAIGSGLGKKLLAGGIVVAIATAITELVVKPALKGKSSGTQHDSTKPGNWWDNPFGANPTDKRTRGQGVSTWAGLGTQIKDLTGFGQSTPKITAPTPSGKPVPTLRGLTNPNAGEPNWTKWWQDFDRDVVQKVAHWITVTLPHYLTSLPGAWASAWIANWHTFDRNVVQPVSRFFTGTIPGWLNSVGRWWAGLWGAAWGAFNRYILQPVLHFFTATVPGWLMSVGRWWNGLWSGAWTAFNRFILQPALHFFTTTVPGWFTTVGRWWSGLWSGAWTAFSRNVLSPVSNFFTRTVPGWFTTVGKWWDGLWSGGWTAFKKHILTPVGNWLTNTMPNSVQNAFKSAVNWVITNVVNKAIGMINDVTSIVGVPKIKPVQKLATGGGVGAASSARGSVAGTGDQDSQLTVLTPGEWVIRKPARMALERQFGPEFLPTVINRADQVYGYAAGGSVGAGPTMIPGYAGGGSIGNIQSWLQTLPGTHPYVWGATGPGSFDCSGLTGEVYARLLGYPDFRRYMVTQSFGSNAEAAGMGFLPGKGTYTVGVNPATHIVGNLAGLRFEARDTKDGIIVGPGATDVSAMQKQFYLAHAGTSFSDGGSGGILGFLEGIGSSLSSAGAGLAKELGLGAKSLLGLAGQGAEAVFNAGWDHIVTPLVSRLTGKNSMVGAVGQAVLRNVKTGVDGMLTASDASGGVTGGGPATGSAAQAQAYASGKLGRYGWGQGQMPYLKDLWNKESGWNRLVRNPNGGAYGIPQALPASKMGAAANPPTSSMSAQVDWGLGYIHDRWGSPQAADANENSAHWYAAGGPVFKGKPQGNPDVPAASLYRPPLAFRKASGMVGSQATQPHPRVGLATGGTVPNQPALPRGLTDAQTWNLYSGKLPGAWGSAFSSFNTLARVTRPHAATAGQWEPWVADTLAMWDQEKAVRKDIATLTSKTGTPSSITAGDFTSLYNAISTWQAGEHGAAIPRSMWSDQRGTKWPKGWTAGKVQPSGWAGWKYYNADWRKAQSATGTLLTDVGYLSNAWSMLYGKPATGGSGSSTPGAGPGSTGGSGLNIDLSKVVTAGGPTAPVYGQIPVTLGNPSSFADGGAIASMFALGGPVDPLGAAGGIASRSLSATLPRSLSDAAAAANGGSTRIGVQTGDITINNPTPEKSGTSLTHAISRQAFLAGRQMA